MDLWCAVIVQDPLLSRPKAGVPLEYRVPFSVFDPLAGSIHCLLSVQKRLISFTYRCRFTKQTINMNAYLSRKNHYPTDRAAGGWVAKKWGDRQRNLGEDGIYTSDLADTTEATRIWREWGTQMWTERASALPGLAAVSCCVSINSISF